jgi:ribosomal protein S18 acetylase RimI-like enzyme
MELWLETNKKAHPFIKESYWEEHYEEVRKLIPEAAVFVYEKDGNILGFIGLMESYVAGIFIDESYQSNGIGRQLLEKVKSIKEELLLQVYVKNSRAVTFYKREGFSIVQEQSDEATLEKEYVMKWVKEKVN